MTQTMSQISQRMPDNRPQRERAALGKVARELYSMSGEMNPTFVARLLAGTAQKLWGSRPGTTYNSLQSCPSVASAWILTDIARSDRDAHQVKYLE